VGQHVARDFPQHPVFPGCGRQPRKLATGVPAGAVLRVTYRKRSGTGQVRGDALALRHGVCCSDSISR
jgi:hypothetical protein